MLLIILGHLIQHGLWYAPDSVISTPFLYAHLFQTWTAQIGNWCFILLSGYFLCDKSSNFQYKKIFYLWVQIFSLSALLGLIAYAAKLPVIHIGDEENYIRQGFFQIAEPPNKRDVIHCLLPLFFRNNWFAVTYIIFYVFVPYLRVLLWSLDKKSHLKLIGIMAVLGVVVKNIPFQNFYSPSDLFLFVLGFFIASYVRLYEPKLLRHTKRNVCIILALCTFFALWNYSAYKYLVVLPFVRNNLVHVVSFFAGGMPRILTLITAVLVFCVFKNCAIKQHVLINKVAATCFGVYLIHEHPLVNKYLWHVIMHSDDFSHSDFVLVYMLLAVLIVFALCSSIEFLRSVIFQRIIATFAGKHE